MTAGSRHAVVRPAHRIRFLVLLAVALFSFGVEARAQATANVPQDAPAYGELDVLRAAGLVPDALFGQRPYSRLTIAHMVAEARSRVSASEDSATGSGSSGGPTTRELEALERLEDRFAGELELLCAEAEGGGDCPGGGSRGSDGAGSSAGAGGVSVHPRVARADLALLQSPWRDIPTRYAVPSDNIDARLNPMVSGRLGRDFVDGVTAGLEGGAEARLGSHVAAYAHPRLSVEDPRDGASDVALGFHQLYLRSVLGNVALEVGRDHLFMGQGFEAGAVASDNPPGYDMVRISNDRPFRFPWFLDALGPASLSIAGADLGSDRDIENALLFLTKLSIRPHPNLELGVTNLNVQGGEGAPSGSTWERVREVLLPFARLPEFSERLAGIDVRWTLPDPGVELYADFAMTDKDLERFDQTVTDEAVWIVGGVMPSFGPEGRLSARAEWTRNGFRPYTHHQFTSGLTQDGFVLGSPLGPAATGVLGRVGWTGPVDRFALTGFWERYLGDLYANVTPGDLSWGRIADNPDEIRLRLVGEWSRLAVGHGFEPSVRLGWERVDRFDFTEDDRTNWLASVFLAYRW